MAGRARAGRANEIMQAPPPIDQWLTSIAHESSLSKKRSMSSSVSPT